MDSRSKRRLDQVELGVDVVRRALGTAHEHQAAVRFYRERLAEYLA